jgi:signal transduction histidine kinase
MKRPWQVWLALAACSLVVAAAMGWLTLHALRADRERSEAQAAAELEQRVSLALWRMDTRLAPLIAAESARPHYLYAPFIAVEGEKAADNAAEADQVASPLLTVQDSNVILNFDASLAGQWNSPQAPTPELWELACANGMTTDQIDANRARLAELAASVDLAELFAQLPVQPLPAWGYGSDGLGVANDALEDGQEQGQQAATPFYGNQSFANPPAEAVEEVEQGAEADDAQRGRGGFGGDGGADDSETLDRIDSANADLGHRSARYQHQVEQEFIKQRRENAYRWGGAVDAVTENVTRPLWMGEHLLLARRVMRGDAMFVQGTWLDWPRLKSELLAEAADLLPGADLVPVRPGERADPTRMLAGLPVQLVAGDAPLAAGAGVSPLQWALAVGWTALALAMIAVAGLLWGVLALSERRAAFVSSVTHELRTPLTTFRMYAEMLVRDMVPTAERRREYLQTLRTEAERLTHLVDNVLAYARLERGRKPRRAERTTPAALVERFESRLAERAAAAEMTLDCRVDPAAGEAALLTDVGVVEQILFNLVDNAAKYAARAADRQIHLEVVRDGHSVGFTVRDHGPGFASLRAAEHSAPFSKSAEQAAESAPGVGLGLALCRRLARELGGQLVVSPKNGEPGAAVTLRLPMDG